MCLVALALGIHEEFPLIVAANRDEFYERPTTRVHYWEDDPTIFAGKDCLRGGSWLGVSKKRRFACVTNIRETVESEEIDFISRGDLVKGFLQSDFSPKEYIRQIKQQKDKYQGFNLIVHNGTQTIYYSNRIEQPIELTAGYYYVSNSTLNVEWPKVKSLQSGFRDVVNARPPLEEIVEQTLKVLQTEDLYLDKELPKTGVGLKWERMLSTIFIKSELYGTRASTIVAINEEGWAHITEQGFESMGVATEKIQENITFL
jgi:uncharacterized protein with NRDE domain